MELKIREATKQGYAIATENDTINIQFPNSKTRRGRVQRGGAGTLETSCNQGVIVPNDALLQIRNGTFGKIDEYSLKGNGPTLTATCYKQPDCIRKGYRIRRLTPKECFRLQGVPDEISQKLFDAGISDTQCYRAAGDAMTVNVLYEIAKSIRRATENV